MHVAMCRLSGPSSRMIAAAATAKMTSGGPRRRQTATCNTNQSYYHCAAVIICLWLSSFLCKFDTTSASSTNTKASHEIISRSSSSYFAMQSMDSNSNSNSISSLIYANAAGGDAISGADTISERFEGKNQRPTSSNSTPTANQEDLDAERSLIIVITVNIVIFSIGFCGNIIVIIVILKFTKNASVTDIYILNLAFADFMFIMGLIFLITTMFIDHWIFGQIMCKLYMSSTSLNQFASSLLLVAMSYDRFIAVCHPIYAQRFRTISRAKLICCIIWLICLILMTPLLFFARVARKGVDTIETETCTIFWPDNQVFSCEVAFTLYSFAIGFAAPLMLIGWFYWCVIRTLRNSAHGTLGVRSASRSRNREHTNKRIERLVKVIICTYTICWLPYWIAQMCVSFSSGDKAPVYWFYEFFLVATSLSYTNSALNPILYAFLSDNFKRRCTDIFVSIRSLCGSKSLSSNYCGVTTTTYVDNENVILGASCGELHQAATILHENRRNETNQSNNNNNNFRPRTFSSYQRDPPPPYDAQSPTTLGDASATNSHQVARKKVELRIDSNNDGLHTSGVDNHIDDRRL